MEQELFKAIFKIEGDSESAIKALNDVNKKYEQSSDLMKDQAALLKKLQAEEAKLIQGRAQANNPTQAAIYNKKLEESAQAITKLQVAMAGTTAGTKNLKKESDSLTESLRQAFDGTIVNAAKTEIEAFNKKIGDSEKPLSSLRTQLKDLKAQIANATSDEEFAKLAAQAGEIQDRLNDATEAARIFATDSKFQSVGRALSGVAGDLLSLDFEGAAQKAKLLDEASKSITFKDGLNGIKSLGTTLLSVGKSLLTNPIFLIGSAVALIVSNFDALTKAGGPVGDFFSGISKAIEFVTTGFVKLTDAIGLTNSEFAKLNQDRIDEFDKNTKKQLDNYDREIRLRRGLGIETESIEIRKQKAIIRTAELEFKAMDAVVQKSKSVNGIIEKDFMVRYEELKKIISEANTEIEIIEKESATRKAERLKKESDDLLAAVEYNLKIRQSEYDRDLEANRKYLTDKEQDNFDAYIKSEELRKQVIQDNIDGDALFEELSKKQDERSQEEYEKKLAIKKQEDQLRQQKIQAELDGINQISNAAANAASQIISAQQNELEKTISFQSQRVQEVRAIAEKGNVQLLELEQKRLDDLNSQREKFVKQQQQLALVELVTNSTIAIAKAAAQGGAAAPFTIAATLIALGAGFIQARSLASSQGFYKGGYTGDGDPRQESTAVGRKPYTYHKAEFVFNHEKTSKFKDIFQDIHSGNIDLHDWQNKVDAFESMRLMPISKDVHIDIGSLQSELKMLRKAVEGQSTFLNFDENGLSARFQNIKVRQDYIKNNLAR